MTDKKPDEHPTRKTVMPLRGAQRGMLVLLGMGGLASGGIAVFETSNQAGTVGLLTIGAVSSLVALVGRVPLRWVIGSNELDMTEVVEGVVGEAVDVMAEVMSTDQLEAANRDAAIRVQEEDVNGAGTIRLNVAEALHRAANFERAAQARMEAFVDRHPDWQWQPQNGVDQSEGDGWLRTPGGQPIAVEFKINLAHRSEAMVRALISRRLSQPEVKAVLFVTDEIPAPGVMHRLRRTKPMASMVAVNEPDNVLILRLRRLLAVLAGSSETSSHPATTPRQR